MTSDEPASESQKSVSWQAYREAEQLSDESLIDSIESLAFISESKDERRAACFLLGAIGKNSKATRCTEILIQRSAIERDKYVLSAALNALENLEKPECVALEPIFHLLDDKRWLVRHSAIAALKGSASPIAEEQLMQHLAKTEDPNDVIYCHATLNSIGTPRSLELIGRSLLSRKRDVKMSAALAISSIQARHGKQS